MAILGFMANKRARIQKRVGNFYKQETKIRALKASFQTGIRVCRGWSIKYLDFYLLIFKTRFDAREGKKEKRFELDNSDKYYYYLLSLL